MRSVIGAGTTYGMDGIQVFYKEGNLHYKCGNVNVSFVKKINSCRFMYILHATTITCILQVSTVAVSQPLLTYILSKSCVYPSHGV
jgi:hypothetical protein